jgi:protein-S-isoprenylcysteine O-methyltransferase Ste14
MSTSFAPFEPTMEAALSAEPIWQTFLVTRRVTISLVLFGLLIAEDIYFGTKPQHGWFRAADGIGLTALAVIVLGLAIRSWAAGTLRKGIDLTTEGPYSLIRHPLYLGSFLVMLGFCLTVGYAHDVLVICGPIVGIYCLTMLREENRLTAKYGERWTTYAARTPRLVPYLPTHFTPTGWSLTQWLRSREYQALLTCTIGFAALEAWRLS